MRQLNSSMNSNISPKSEDSRGKVWRQLWCGFCCQGLAGVSTMHPKLSANSITPSPQRPYYSASSERNNNSTASSGVQTSRAIPSQSGDGSTKDPKDE